MPSWTPGPWRAAYNGTCWQVDAEGHAVATTQFCYAPETEANARLIAAAPELYEALIAMVSMKPHVWECDCAACNKARTAIAKARGEP